MSLYQRLYEYQISSGADPGGWGAPGAHPPPKIGKNMIFLRKIVIFHTRLRRRVPLVEQELPTLPEHLISPPGFSGVRVTRSLVVNYQVMVATVKLSK
jgi:hypothetical protein